MDPSFRPLLGPSGLDLFSSPFQPPTDPFMNLCISRPKNRKNPKPVVGFTANQSPTFLATGNPCLDFFFLVVPDTPPAHLIKLLDQAWSQNPLTTLKLICHLRSVRGTGKADKEGLFVAALWLYKNHPRTLAANIKLFASFGCFKDLPEILLRLIEGIDARRERKQNRSKPTKGRGNRQKLNQDEGDANFSMPDEEKRILQKKILDVVRSGAKIARKEKIKSMAEKAIDRYCRDASYRLVHDSIAQVFADQLILDLKFLESGKSEDLFKISLASKWCPSLDSSYDRATLLCENIARRVFPVDSYREYEGIREDAYAFRVRHRLRKEVLTPLRGALELPERYMSSQQWKSLPYNRVPSVAMKRYETLFRKHDETRFGMYLESVERGEAKIASGALLPHEILASLKHKDRGGEVAELQWRRMVEEMSKKGKLNNSLAVCDISTSMQGMASKVAIALSMLISDMSEEPWKGKIITFNHTAELHQIEGESLRSKMEFFQRRELGENTDLQKAFDLILRVAVKGKMNKDKMIRKLFVFSDMEFDRAAPNNWETDYEAIRRKFRENGYYWLPEIVFWNLRDSNAIPVASGRKGVALVSGFSNNLIKLFLDGGGTVNPEDVMERAISGPEYRKLLLLD